jgi:proline racemase
MPTRVVTGGVAMIPGGTMLERKEYFEQDLDDLPILKIWNSGRET